MKHEHFLPCECGCSVALVTEYEAFREDPPEFYVSFYLRQNNPTLRWRIGAAWKMLRGRQDWIHDVSTTPEAMERLADFINVRRAAGIKPEGQS